MGLCILRDTLTTPVYYVPTPTSMTNCPRERGDDQETEKSNYLLRMKNVECISSANAQERSSWLLGGSLK